MRKKSRSRQSILLYLLIWSFILCSVSDFFYQTPQLSQNEPFSGNRTRLSLVTKPIAACIPDSGSEIERILTVIHQENLPNRTVHKQDFFFNIANIIFGKKIMNFSLSRIWRADVFPSDQMRRSLIEYIHHKEDQH